MKKSTLTFLTGIMILTSVNAMARVFGPGEERPIKAAQMTKLQATGSFLNAEEVSLTLVKEDAARIPTGLFLNYINSSTGEIRSIRLPIVEKRNAGCGSVEYIANLTLSNEDRDHRDLPPYYMDRSISITLKDHSRRLCMDLPANLWEANVVESEGFCLVSHMSLEGHPENIYTIQQLEE